MKLLLFAVLAAGFAASAQSVPAPGSATVKDLAFLAGSWHTSNPKSEMDEVWTAPSGGNMLGMFRILRGGNIVLTEICSIEQTPEGLVLFLRHFGPRGVAMEEKDKPYAFKLESLDTNKASFFFEGTSTRIIYTRKSDTEMEAVVEKPGKDGKPVRQVFPYQAKPLI